MSKLVENYLLQQSVGKGKYGQVYRAEHQKTKRIFAVKVIPKSSFQLNPKLQQLAINEINILSSIKHQNIVAFIQTLKTPNNFYFVYEYCNEGTLQTLIKTKKYLKQSQALILFRQLLQAFKQLNKNNIMHRDLKPDNIFLSYGLIKLGDFGFCKMLESNMTQTMLGSPIYMAPEILKEQIYTSKADIWSLGVVLFQMLFGYCPFESSSISELVNKLKQDDIIIPFQINKISQETQILLRKMLVKDQFKRIQWVDLFGFVINQQGKIVSGCKKQFAIQNLQRYFFNENDTNTTNNNNNIIINLPNFVHTISIQSPNKSGTSSSNQNSLKTVQSTERSINAIDQIRENNKCGQRYPFISGFNIEIKEEPKIKYPQNYQISNNSYGNFVQENSLVKKSSKGSSNGDSSTNGKLVFRRKSEVTQVDPLLKKKLDKQKFIDVHNRLVDAIKLIEDLVISSNGNQIQICIYILFDKMQQRLQKMIQIYPQWIDIIKQQSIIIKQSIGQIVRQNRQLTILFDDQKQNKEEKFKKLLAKIWKNSINKFTLERAIRGVFDKISKDVSVEDILK